MKKVLWFWFRQKTAYSGERISQKSFSRNAHEYDKSLEIVCSEATLYTLFAFRTSDEAVVHELAQLNESFNWTNWTSSQF